MKNSYLSIIAIILSGVSIVLYFFEFGPIQIDPIGYFGLIAACIAISVTLLIGYQIFRAFEIKKDIEFLRKKVNDIDEIKEQIENEGYRISAHLMYLAGTIAVSNNNFLYGFFYQHSSLLNTIKVGEDGWVKNVTLLIDNLKSILPEFAPSVVWQYNESLRNSFEKVLKSIQESNKEIRGNKNYPVIEERFEKLMSAFCYRVEKFKLNEPIDKNEKKIIDAI